MSTAADAFATLSKEELLKIRTVILSSQASIAGLKSSKRRLVKSIDIQLEPMLQYQTQAEKAKRDASAGVNIIPAELALDSAELSKLNPGIQKSLVGKSEAELNVAFDISYMKAEKKLVVAEISQLDALDKYFSDMIVAINDALSRP